ncbi:MAG TPA: hypothetical protein VN922_14985 [Bacteroidia bacterium]|nr:hypothetical protein [Bacteroidia bacterium]
MKLKNVLVGISILILGCGISKAQFTDYNNYPVTVTPHESPDSTRGHFWGYMFGSYYTKLHCDSFQRGNTQYARIPVGSNAFSLQRIYLGYDYFFNKQFSVHAVMASEESADDNYVSSPTVDPKNNRSFYLKYANMEWANFLNTGLKLTVGLAPTPSFAITEEPFWGYRSIDRTIMDMKGITGSNDFGANLGGKIWSKKDEMGVENACVGFNFMVANGTSSQPDLFDFPTYSVWHKYYGNLYVKMLDDKLVLDLFGDGHTIGYTAVSSYGPVMHNYILTGRIFLGYKTKNFNISAEYFQQTEKNMLSEISGPGVPKQGDTVDNIQTGFSIMAAAVLMRDKNTNAPKLSLIARYDMFNPVANYNPKVTYLGGGMYINGTNYELNNTPYTETYFVFGFDYQPIKQLHFMPNIWYDGIRSEVADVVYRNRFDYDLVARITFYYQFFKN